VETGLYPEAFYTTLAKRMKERVNPEMDDAYRFEHDEIWYTKQ